MSLAIRFPQGEIPGVPFRLKEERPSPLVPQLHNIMGGNVAKTQHVCPPDVSFPLPSLLPSRCPPAARSSVALLGAPLVGLPQCRAVRQWVGGGSECADGDDVSRANGRRGAAAHVVVVRRAALHTRKEACLLCCSNNVVLQIMIRYGLFEECMNEYMY